MPLLLFRFMPLLLFLFCVAPQAQAATSVITDVSLSVTSDGTSLEMLASSRPEAQIRLLQSPPRIVLDLHDTVLATTWPIAENVGVIGSVREGLAQANFYRIVMALRQPAIPLLEIGQETSGVTAIRVKLRPVAEDEFAQAVGARVSAGQSGSDAAFASNGDKPLVVIDPGHGGIDNGATGIGGTLEKQVNLAFALTLRQEILQNHPDVRVLLTRETDEFVGLARRTSIGRENRADLMISIHADSIDYPQVRGATVYTLSEKASDSMSQTLALGENAADRFAGPEWEQDTPEIHDILVDLVRRETEVFSDSFADYLVKHIKEGGLHMINNPRRSAGFRVLRAPDVPSVLLELGYLSNVEDEAQVSSPQWQKKAAMLTANAISDYLQSRASAGALPAQ
ncbi:N-acetylmuramoyl-L-alanine amidase [Aureimonas fodinaquatilis]|uniref:N-acetylmuramoyl-L-alanine amidase n=1 Tax=Aureimonas fodinaquatilis TaxID=2565783 RepID=A0A5B0DUS2_9HYPH|nr:N-acetylmuramoyl-L-alanine amidase [Aureimonas fodinaquatilis]KAA0970557.1 N-acetylmuramoyl-L-alanine amidase [Aureimonas fodinaquatilis]